MPTGAYVANFAMFAYVSVPYHAVTACKVYYVYGSVTGCGYFAVHMRNRYLLVSNQITIIFVTSIF